MDYIKLSENLTAFARRIIYTDGMEILSAVAKGNTFALSDITVDLPNCMMTWFDSENEKGERFYTGVLIGNPRAVWWSKNQERFGLPVSPAGKKLVVWASSGGNNVPVMRPVIGITDDKVNKSSALTTIGLAHDRVPITEKTLAWYSHIAFASIANWHHIKVSAPCETPS